MVAMKNTNWMEEMDYIYAQQEALDAVYGAENKDSSRKGKKKYKYNSPSQLDQELYYGEQMYY